MILERLRRFYSLVFFSLFSYLSLFLRVCRSYVTKVLSFLGLLLLLYYFLELDATILD